MDITSSHRLVARMPVSQAGDASSSLAESIPRCPHCEALGKFVIFDLTIAPGEFTVCLTCREIIRADRSGLRQIEEHDWMELCKCRELFVSLLRWRMGILIQQLRAPYGTTPQH